jgi:transmembrane sensor
LKDNNDDIDDLIAKYLAGETSRKESEAVQNWLRENEANQKHFNQVKTIFTVPASTSHLHEFDTNAAWEKFRAKVESAGGKRQKTTKTREINWFLKIAAGIVLISVVSVLLFQVFKRSESETVNFVANQTTVSDTLPDGSKVYLNKTTQAAYTFDVKTKVHTVRLKGEAYFRIKSEQQKNFIVEVENLHVRDIGTSFSVKAYPESETIEVTVDEGEVQFYSDNDSGIKLNALTKGVYDKKSKKFSMTASEPNASAYLTRSFVFNNETLRSVITRLNMVYGQEVELDPRLNDCRLTSTFVDENLETIVQVIAETFNVSATQFSSGWQLTGEGCGP